MKHLYGGGEFVVPCMGPPAVYSIVCLRAVCGVVWDSWQSQVCANQVAALVAERPCCSTCPYGHAW